MGLAAANIVLTGGNVMFPNFERRFLSEIRPMIPDIFPINVSPRELPKILLASKLMSPHHPKISNCLGLWTSRSWWLRLPRDGKFRQKRSALPKSAEWNGVEEGLLGAWQPLLQQKVLRLMVMHRPSKNMFFASSSFHWYGGDSPSIKKKPTIQAEKQ